ncbi:MAG: ASKHA domain-containing protein [Rectinemataceae bacterium]
MQYLLTVSGPDGVGETVIEGGSTLLDALIAAGMDHMEAPCSGKGLCGKCRVRASGALSPPEPRERELLSEAELAAGLRLACRARALGDVVIQCSVAGEAAILARGVSVEVAPDSPCVAVPLVLPASTLDDQLDDESRLLRALAGVLPGGRAPSSVRFSALAPLAAARGPSGLTAIVAGTEVLAVEPDSRPRRRFGIGVDIGTTTVVAHLVDLATGERLGHRSAVNDQRAFGADVISRIAATIERPDGLAELRGRIASQIGGMVHSLARSAGAAPADILTLAVAGNTTMLHLLAAVPPAAIAVAPFPAVFTRARACSPRDLGLDLPESCAVFLLPGVSGYVGADIVAGIMAVGMAERRETALLLDIGTNGEIALGSADGILCCATAAGPAFEGAGIEMGMGGVAGAVDSVWTDGSNLGSTTIGGEPALGLCGSGVIDALAVFLDCGLVDATGRVADAEEAAFLPAGIASLRREGGPRLYVDPAAGIYLSQGDIRQIQLAKAAIAAGIEVLLARAGKSAGDIDRVYLAGGFGSALDLKSAIRIGLLPRELRDRVVVAGNTAGEGAVAACLSRDRLAECDRIRELCSYVELSSRPDFNAAYVEHMMFPEAK